MIASFLEVFSISAEWPKINTENKPGVRWWWLGSAVDKTNLTWNLEQLSQAGIGAVEITPIYGVKGNDANDIEFLSDKWMSMYNHVWAEANRLNMNVDMNTGTGWPFGGPQISAKDAAAKLIIKKIAVKALPGGRNNKQNIIIKIDDKKQKDAAVLQAILFYGIDGIRETIPTNILKDSLLQFGFPEDGTLFVLYSGRTFQQVKRAAPGGEGLVMNHFSKNAVNKYLSRFEDAFNRNSAKWPDNFFNDSYEVYGADWSDNLIDEFKNRRGYDITEYLPEMNGEGEPMVRARVLCDYRETLSDMLLENFTSTWSSWAKSHGTKTRNQAHGSPGNLLDLYGLIDIPECETFGITGFEIPGLRLDSVHKKNDSKPSIMKFASSAAHVTGKKYTSSESMTWLTEHFRTSLSQIKPEMDQLFINGVNHVYYHGSPYTPKDAKWPGWLFYASILVNPNNTIFRDISGLNDYIARVQSFMQSGTPDNEVLLYFPIYDIWQTWDKGAYVSFDIHKITEKLPAFENIVNEIRDLGYDLDYISDKQILATNVEGKSLVTQGGKYKMIMVPDCKYMPVETAHKLLKLTKEGATVVFLNRLPENVPGLNEYEKRQAQLKEAISEFKLFPVVSSYSGKPFGKGRIMYGNSIPDILEQVPCKLEEIKAKGGADFIRRRTNDGYVYFISMLKNKSVDGWIKLGVNAKSAAIYDPLSGKTGRAALKNNDGKSLIYLQLQSGQSLIIRTYDEIDIENELYPVYVDGKIDFKNEYQNPALKAKKTDMPAVKYLKGDWSFTFTDGEPKISGNFQMKGNPVYWTDLSVSDSKIFAGTGRYSLQFKMPKSQADEWLLDLGNICESARVTINGQYAGMIWSLPYRLEIGKYLNIGKTNTITIDVTNLPANRISDYDKRGVEWRIFKEINLVDLAYKNTTYDKWPVMPSGISGQPRIIPLIINKDIK
jgi:hypothetical protein